MQGGSTAASNTDHPCAALLAAKSDFHHDMPSQSLNNTINTVQQPSRTSITTTLWPGMHLRDVHPTDALAIFRRRLKL